MDAVVLAAAGRPGQVGDLVRYPGGKVRRAEEEDVVSRAAGENVRAGAIMDHVVAGTVRPGGDGRGARGRVEGEMEIRQRRDVLAGHRKADRAGRAVENQHAVAVALAGGVKTVD